MKENTEEPSLSLSTEVPRITYYSGERRRCRPIYGTTYDGLLRRAGETGARYIIVQRNKIEERCADFFTRLDEKILLPIYRTYLDEEKPGSEIIVYRIKKDGE